MKPKKSVSLLLFLFLPFLLMAGESRMIEQFIAKNIDGAISDFSLFYHNTSDSELRINAFSTANHYLSLGTEKGNYIYTAYIDPPRFYAISNDYHFINHNIFEEKEIKNELRTKMNSGVLSWHITHQSKEPAQIYLSGAINSNMDLFHKNQKDCCFC